MTRAFSLLIVLARNVSECENAANWMTKRNSHTFTQKHTHTKERASKALEFAIERHTKCCEVWKGFEYMTGI